MLYLLPGMGANKQMYQGAWRQCPGITFVDWPRYQGEASLSAIADRLIQEYRMTSHDHVGGSSFGGMVSIEIYKILKIPRVVLLGSALTVSEIRPLLRLLAPFASLAPIQCIQLLTQHCDSHVLAMFRAADPAFIKAMCLAASQWSGYVGDTSDFVRIHGERDPIIQPPQDAEIIKGAGHLVAMTHPDACVRVLEKNTEHA